MAAHASSSSPAFYTYQKSSSFPMCTTQQNTKPHHECPHMTPTKAPFSALSAPSSLAPFSFSVPQEGRHGEEDQIAEGIQGANKGSRRTTWKHGDGKEREVAIIEPRESGRESHDLVLWNDYAMQIVEKELPLH